MRTIAVINQKGGVGKTTSCCNLGAALAAAGKSVLLIDLDPQAHLTMHLGVEPNGDRPSIYEILTDGTPIADTLIQVRDNLKLVPSHIDLAAAEMELVSVMGREIVLAEALRAANHQCDILMIDCPPSLGVLTINGLAAVQEVLIPMQPHFLALQGVGKLLESIDLIHNRINRGIRVAGIILCMYEAGTRLAGEVAADLVGFIEASRNTDRPWSDARVFDTIIRRNIKLAECPSHGQTIFEYASRSNGAADYARLSEEIFGVGAAFIVNSVADSATIPAASGATTMPAAAEPTIEASARDSQDETQQPVTESTQPADDPVEIDDPTSEPQPAVPVLDAGDRSAYGPDVLTATSSSDVGESQREAQETAAADRSDHAEDATTTTRAPREVAGVRTARIPVMLSDDVESRDFDFAAAQRRD